MSVPIVVRGGILATNGSELPQDAFGRVRTSLPVPHVLNLNVRSSSGYVMDGSVLSNATIVLNNTAGTPAPTVSLTATGTGGITNNRALRQSYTRVNYVPGISRYYLFTSLLKDATNTAVTGLTAVNQAYTRVGAYDDNFGLFWQYDKFTDKIYVGIRQNGAETLVAQDAFNVSNLQNITGLSPTSPVTVDFTKMQVLYIDQEWLGVGSVRFGVYLENTLVIAHVVTNINALLQPYTATPNYPLRHEVFVTAAATGTLKYTECCSACLNDEGTIPSTVPPSCVVLSYITTTALTLASPAPGGSFGTETAILAIRATASPTGIMNGINSYISIRSIQGTVLSPSDIVLLRVYRVFSHLGQSALGRVNYGSVTAGGAWTNATANAPNFGDTGYPLGLLEVIANTTITAFTQGILIATITATTSNTGLRFDPGAVPFGVSLDGTADIVLVTASAGTNAPRVTVGFEWAQPT